MCTIWHVHFTSGAHVLFRNWLACHWPVPVLNDILACYWAVPVLNDILACYWPVTVPNYSIGMLIELRNVRMCYIFSILYTAFLAASQNPPLSPELHRSLWPCDGPGFIVGSTGEALLPPREALTSSLRLQLTLQVTCDPQDSIAGIPPSKGVIHGSCGSNLAFAVVPFVCCYAALLCYTIFATAPAPHLLKHYNFYLFTTYFFFISINHYAMGPDPGHSLPKF